MRVEAELRIMKTYQATPGSLRSISSPQVLLINSTIRSMCKGFIARILLVYFVHRLVARRNSLHHLVVKPSKKSVDNKTVGSRKARATWSRARLRLSGCVTLSTTLARTLEATQPLTAKWIRPSGR